MHHTGDLRSIRNLVSFIERQGVYVGSQGDKRLAFTQIGYYSRPPDTPPDAATQLLKCLGNNTGSAVFIETKLRVHVEVTPPGGQLFGDLLSFLEHVLSFYHNGHDGHEGIPSRPLCPSW
jgi:hypothetical protein